MCKYENKSYLCQNYIENPISTCDFYWFLVRVAFGFLPQNYIFHLYCLGGRTVTHSGVSLLTGCLFGSVLPLQLENCPDVSLSFSSMLACLQTGFFMRTSWI